MSRPKKQTVDYFPHDCLHKGTMFIIEQKYGNDGYSFWFKLLELLGTSEGHFIDCNNQHDWLFLTAKTRLTEDLCTEILNMLASLKAIDQELWELSKIIWSDNFIGRIADAYRNRTSGIPIKPAMNGKKPSSIGVSDVRNPQTKLKETKLKETITIPDWIDKGLWEAFKEKRKELKKPLTGKAEELAIGKLTKLKAAGHDPSELLKESIINSWQSFFPPRNNYTKSLPDAEIEEKKRKLRNTVEEKERKQKILDALEEDDERKSDHVMAMKKIDFRINKLKKEIGICAQV